MNEAEKSYSLQLIIDRYSPLWLLLPPIMKNTIKAMVVGRALTVGVLNVDVFIDDNNDIAGSWQMETIRKDFVRGIMIVLVVVVMDDDNMGYQISSLVVG